MTNRELKFKPKDGISSVKFNPIHDNLLAASSWDKNVYVYNVMEDSPSFSWTSKAPVLDCCWAIDGKSIISGGLDKICSVFDVESQSVVSLGNHDAPISCCTSNGKDTVVTGSWDKSVKVWDLRDNKEQTLLSQPDKVFSADIDGYYMVVALAGRIIQIYDLRNTSEMLDSRESSLKYMLRKVCCIPNGTGFASSSIEGRVSIEPYLKDSDPSSKFTFKCHREKTETGEIIYPVNAIAYHSKQVVFKANNGFYRFNHVFATGGGDGIVNIWDGNLKKRQRQFPAYPTSISSLDFNRDATLLAVASSYTYESGEKE